MSATDEPGTREARVAGYAHGVLAIARSEGLVDRVSNELFHFARAFDSNDLMRSTLSDEAIPVERRQGMVEEILGERASPLTAALASFIVGAGRARYLVSIVDKVVELAAEERKHEVAEVRSAHPLDEDQQRRIAEALSNALDKNVEVKVVVDPSVMGGVIARVGDTVIDGSIRHRIEKLREVL